MTPFWKTQGCSSVSHHWFCLKTSGNCKNFLSLSLPIFSMEIVCVRCFEDMRTVQILRRLPGWILSVAVAQPPAQGGLTFFFEALFVEDLPWLLLESPGNLQLRRESSIPSPTVLLSPQYENKRKGSEGAGYTPLCVMCRFVQWVITVGGHQNWKSVFPCHLFIPSTKYIESFPWHCVPLLKFGVSKTDAAPAFMVFMFYKRRETSK